MKSRLSRVPGVLAAALLTATVPVAIESPAAHAAEQQVTGATLTWGLNGYAQVGAAFGPWTYPRLSGDVTVLAGSVSGGTQSEYAVAPQPVTSMPVSSPPKTPNAVKFVFGSGTADPATGAATLAWSGSYTVNAYPKAYGAPDEVYADPVLTTAANGTGTLTMKVTIGAGQSMDGEPIPAQQLGRLTVATFGPGADTVTGDTFRLTPDYQGVSVTETTPQVTCPGDTWGSWPAAFVNAMPDDVAPHFYSTSCGGLQKAKPPLPLDLDLGLSGQAPASATLVAPSTTYGEPATARLTAPGATGAASLSTGGVDLARTTLTGSGATFALGKPVARSYDLVATYFGSATASPARATATLTVRRTTSSTAIAVTKKPTPRTAGALRITVTSPTTVPTGPVRVRVQVMKGGTPVASRTGNLSRGRATVALPRLPKGRYDVRATYPGSDSVARSSRTITLKVA